MSGTKITIAHTNGSKDEADTELKAGTLNDGSKNKVMIWKRKIGPQPYTWRFERKQ